MKLKVKNGTSIIILLTTLLLTCILLPIFMQETEDEVRERNITILKQHGEVVAVKQGTVTPTSAACVFKKVSHEVKDSVLMYETYWEIFDEQLKALAELTKFYDVILYTK